MALTQARLRELVRYDGATGRFVRLVRTSPRVAVGQIAGCVNASDGYVYVRVAGKRYAAHRLAWLYMTGAFPEHEIDHINGVRDDNRWDNLRQATSGQNHQNAAAHHDNRAGLLGVTPYHRGGGRFVAQIQVNGKPKNLGVFPSAVEAHGAYLAAKAELHPFNPVAR